MINVIMYASAAVLVLFALLGLARGFGKTLPRFFAAAAAAILTVLFAGKAGVYLANADLSFTGLRFNGFTVTTPIETARKLIENSNESVVSLFEGHDILPAALDSLVITACSALAFILLFIASLIVCLIVAAVISSIVSASKKKAGFLSHISGMVLGCVSAALCLFMLMAPVVGAFSYAGDALTEIGEMEKLNEADAYINNFNQSSVTEIYSKLGCRRVGRAYIRNSSKLTYNEKTLYMTDELDTIAALVGALGETGVLESGNMGEALKTVLSDSKSMGAVIKIIMKSEILKEIIPDIAGASVEKSLLKMGVPANEKEAGEKMWADISNAVVSSGLDNDDIRGLYLSADANASDADFAYTNEINDIPGRFSALLSRITEILNVYTEGKGTPDETASQNRLRALIIITSVKDVDEFNEASALPEKLSLAYSDNISSGNTVALLDIRDGELFVIEKVGKDEIGEINIKDITAESAGKAVLDNLSAILYSESEENADELGNAVSSVIVIVNAFNSDGNASLGGMDVNQAKNLGAAMDGNTQIGNIFKTLVNAASVSGDGNILPISVSNGINEMLEDENTSAEDMLGTAVIVINLTENIGKTLESGEKTEEEKKENNEAVQKSLKELAQNITDENYELIRSKFITYNSLLSMGIPSGNVSLAKDAIDSLFLNLLEYRKSGAPEESFKYEADFIMYFIGMISDGTQNGIDLQDVDSIITCSQDSAVVRNTLVSLGSSFDVYGIGDMITNEAKQQIKASAGKIENDNALLQAVYNIFGIN